MPYLVELLLPLSDSDGHRFPRAPYDETAAELTSGATMAIRIVRLGTPERQRLIALLARLSHQADFSIGCYCERGTHCHRSLLGRMLREHGAEVIDE